MVSDNEPYELDEQLTNVEALLHIFRVVLVTRYYTQATVQEEQPLHFNCTWRLVEKVKTTPKNNVIPQSAISANQHLCTRGKKKSDTKMEMLMDALCSLHSTKRHMSSSSIA